MPTPTKEGQYFNWSGLHGATMLRLPSQDGEPTGGMRAGGASVQTCSDQTRPAEDSYCSKNSNSAYIGAQVRW